MFKKKQQHSHSFVWGMFALSAGFLTMLILSIFAYQLEARYVHALEGRVSSQQGKIIELEHKLTTQN